MTSALGYLGWCLSALAWAGLLALHYPRPNLAGDQAMGYGLGLMAACLTLLAGLVLVAVVMIRRDGISFPMSLVPLAGAAAVAVGAFFYGVLRTEPAPGILGPLRWLAASHALIWLPGLTLAALAVFLVPSWRHQAPVWLWQWSLLATAGLSAVGLLTALTGWAAGAPARMESRVREHRMEDAARIGQHLTDIRNWEPSSGVLPLLALTGRYHEPAVREAAVARIHSLPDWESQLRALLDHAAWYPEVYTYLDGNTVTNPEGMVKPLESSIRRMAGDIRSQIRDANNLQSWSFDHMGIERLLRAVDGQFSPYKSALVPALRDVGQAFRTPPPERFRGVRFDTARSLEKWLSRHSPPIPPQ